MGLLRDHEGIDKLGSQVKGRPLCSMLFMIKEHMCPPKKSNRTNLKDSKMQPLVLEVLYLIEKAT